jgi:hypothetical protein
LRPVPGLHLVKRQHESTLLLVQRFHGRSPFRSVDRQQIFRTTPRQFLRPGHAADPQPKILRKGREKQKTPDQHDDAAVFPPPAPQPRSFVGRRSMHRANFALRQASANGTPLLHTLLIALRFEPATQKATDKSHGLSAVSRRASPIGEAARGAVSRKHLVLAVLNVNTRMPPKRCFEARFCRRSPARRSGRSAPARSRERAAGCRCVSENARARAFHRSTL